MAIVGIMPLIGEDDNMHRLGTHMLETERLVLRRITMNDYKMMFYNWACLEECSKFFPWAPAKDIDIYKDKVASWVANYENGLYFNWIIEYKRSKEVIGIINLHNVDEVNQVAETSYILCPKYWGKGIMTEALNQVLQYAFEEIKVNRVQADVFQGNFASEKVLTKCGMQKEGIARKRYYKEGAYIDSIQYAVLRDEWLAFL